MIKTLAFDADDTLWHNHPVFSLTQKQFCDLLVPYMDSIEGLGKRLEDMEIRNLKRFGYGIKGFTLSMIETAVEATEGRISSADIRTLLDYGKAMLDHPVELLDGVRETLERIAGDYPLMIITKGDLFDQEGKIARSGLADMFPRIEIVSEKDMATYQKIMQRHSVDGPGFMMVGNSVRSDILPVLKAGGRAVHIPYITDWVHERVDNPEMEFPVLSSIRDLPDWLRAGFPGKG
ncbi:MAG: HAD family hydrolase [Pseudomonadota bacterium]|nr:HAD family hydrolase [Pseudomonadota bacterium]